MLVCIVETCMVYYVFSFEMQCAKPHGCAFDMFLVLHYM